MTQRLARRSRLRRRGWRLLQYALMVVAALVALFPLYWMVSSSLKSAQELQQLPPSWWPETPLVEAFIAVFDVVPFHRAIVNSVIIAGGTTVSIVVTSVMAGYVFAKYRFRGREAIFYGVLATMFLPPIVMLVPLFRIIQELGLVNTYLGVMLPHLANAFGVFLMRQYIAGLSDELIEAARVDGASEWAVVWKIIAPLSAPAIATLALFAFVFHWNSFLWPLTVLQSEDMFTTTLAMNRLVSYTTSVRFQNVVMAGTTIGILPSIALFLWLARYYMRGITGGGVKG